jgi:hypothetical protein
MFFPSHVPLPYSAIDLDSYSFDAWVAFVFDHPVDEEHSWKYEPEWRCTGDPVQLLAHIVQLFEAPDFLLDAFSPAQVREGLSYLSMLLRDWLWDKDIPWDLREACIRSTVALSQRIFAREPCDDACLMWWDWLIFSRHMDAQERDAVLSALTGILTIPSVDCWQSALHGLGHLDHPGKQAVIERFLGDHPDLSDEGRAYALAAIDGEVL